MNFLRNSDAEAWCKVAPRFLTIHREVGIFHSEVPQGIKYDVPSEYWSLINLLHRLLSVPTKGSFEGGLVWQLRWWGEKDSEKVTLKILEKVRQGYGELRPLEDAPACLFDSGELIDALAFLVHPLLNTWKVQFMSTSGLYIVDSTVSGYLYFMARNERVVDEMLERTEGWKPRRDIPGCLKQAESDGRVP